MLTLRSFLSYRTILLASVLCTLASASLTMPSHPTVGISGNPAPGSYVMPQGVDLTVTVTAEVGWNANSCALYKSTTSSSGPFSQVGSYTFSGTHSSDQHTFSQTLTGTTWYYGWGNSTSGGSASSPVIGYTAL